MLAGCFTPPDLNLKHLATLKLQQSQRADFEAVYGEPRSARTKTHETGRYEVVAYAKAFDNFSDNCMRAMEIELKDGRLNGYLAGSSCDEDRTNAPVEKAPQLMQGKGTLTKDQIAELMGAHSGIARCPSFITGYEKLCEGSAEVWAWFSVPDTPLVGGTIRSATVVAGFDERGTLVAADANERELKR